MLHPVFVIIFVQQLYQYGKNSTTVLVCYRYREALSVMALI